jgi:hypothetical protein
MTTHHQQLLPENYKVWYEYGETPYTPSGRTVYGDLHYIDARNAPQHRTVTAHVLNDSGEEIATGTAVCNERKDTSASASAVTLPLGER